MTWPPQKSTYQILLEVAEQSTIHHFQVEVPYQDGMVFRPHKHISISLKGAMLEPCQTSGAPHALCYPNGVVL